MSIPASSAEAHTLYLDPPCIDDRLGAEDYYLATTK